MVKSIEKRVCDVCGKDGGEGTVDINGKTFTDVCDKCVGRFESLAERIATPPTRGKRKAKADIEAEKKNGSLGFVKDPLS